MTVYLTKEQWVEEMTKKGFTDKMVPKDKLEKGQVYFIKRIEGCVNSRQKNNDFKVERFRAKFNGYLSGSFYHKDPTTGRQIVTEEDKIGYIFSDMYSMKVNPETKVIEYGYMTKKPDETLNIRDRDLASISYKKRTKKDAVLDAVPRCNPYIETYKFYKAPHNDTVTILKNKGNTGKLSETEHVVSKLQIEKEVPTEIEKNIRDYIGKGGRDKKNYKRIEIKGDKKLAEQYQMIKDISKQLNKSHSTPSSVFRFMPVTHNQQNNVDTQFVEDLDYLDNENDNPNDISVSSDALNTTQSTYYSDSDDESVNSALNRAIMDFGDSDDEIEYDTEGLYGGNKKIKKTKKTKKSKKSKRTTRKAKKGGKRKTNKKKTHRKHGGVAPPTKQTTSIPTSDEQDPRFQQLLMEIYNNYNNHLVATGRTPGPQLSWREIVNSDDRDLRMCVLEARRRLSIEQNIPGSWF